MPSRTDPRPAAAATAGFTLLEVLVAFTIAAIATVSVLGVLGDGVGAERRAATSVLRTLEAWSRLEEAAAAPGSAPTEGRLVTGEVWLVEARQIDPPGARPGGLIAWDVVLTVFENGRPMLRLGTVALSP